MLSHSPHLAPHLLITLKQNCGIEGFVFSSVWQNSKVEIVKQLTELQNLP